MKIGKNSSWYGSGSRLLILVGTLALVAAACGDNNGNGNDNVGASPTPTITPTQTVTPTTSPSPTETPTESPTETPTATPTESPTPAPEACPSKLSFEVNPTAADLDTGWTGIAHDQDVVGDGILTVQVDSCDNPNRPCGVCSFSGPIRNLEKAQNQRCSDDSSIECTSDGDCAGAGSCVFFFGAPLPLSAGAVPVCVTNKVVGGVSGTANIETGDALTAVLQLTSSVFTGLEVAKPCPTCEGDTAPLDGARDGTCSGGARNGQACDVGGRSPSFGNTSFDCPPSPGANIGNLSIKLGPIGTGTFTRTLSEESPNCTAFGWTGLKCFCQTCATAGAEPCLTDADCPGGAKCGGKRCSGGSANGSACESNADCPDGGLCTVPGQPTQAHSCPTADCDVSTGTCPDQFDFLCDQERFRGCTSNADCPKPGDTCTFVPRPCYIDNGQVGGTVTAAGAPSVPVNKISTPTMATLFCIPPTSASAVNSTAGLPGLGRLTLPGTATQID